MGLTNIWKNYRVFIVSGIGMVLIHWGWYKIKSNPLFQPRREDLFQEPDIVRYVLQQEKENKEK